MKRFTKPLRKEKNMKKKLTLTFTFTEAQKLQKKIKKDLYFKKIKHDEYFQCGHLCTICIPLEKKKIEELNAEIDKMEIPLEFWCAKCEEEIAQGRIE